MSTIQNIMDFLFSTYTGLACLIIGGILINCIIAALLEHHTKKRFPDYSDSKSDEATTS